MKETLGPDNVYWAKLGNKKAFRHFMIHLYPRYTDDKLPGGIVPWNQDDKQLMAAENAVLSGPLKRYFSEKLNPSHKRGMR